MKIFRNTPVYVVAYLLFMLPTYILPYFGSNSALMNSMGIGLGAGFLPQWWAHVWSLVMLAMITWVRGGWIGKTYLPIFPVLAAVFDMFPLLSAIPLIPTILHVIALIMGSITSKEGDVSQVGNDQLARKALMGITIMTVLAVGGGLFSVFSMSTRGGNTKSAHPSTFSMAPSTSRSATINKSPAVPERATIATMSPPAPVVPVLKKTPEQPVAESKPPAPVKRVAYKPPQTPQSKPATLATSNRPKLDDNTQFTTLDKANAEIDRAMDRRH